MMITRHAVTLAPDTAGDVARILNEYARAQWDHARRTKSAAIRGCCEASAQQAADLERAIVRRMYEPTTRSAS